MADIYQHQLNDSAAANAAFHEIMRRTPHLNHAHLAAERIVRKVRQ
jgi:hypothetical protein